MTDSEKQVKLQLLSSKSIIDLEDKQKSMIVLEKKQRLRSRMSLHSN
ncbi:MAG: hypothetical protein ACTSWW_01485 [Promethearchaeota archaeon]